MFANTQIATQLHTVRAPLTFLEPGSTDGKPKVLTRSVQGDGPARTGTFSGRLVEIADARPFKDRLSLDVEGFELHDHFTATRDFLDDAQVRAVYYPEAEGLIRRATGASAVHFFDHTVRIESQADRGDAREPVQIVHNDYTERSGPQRIVDLLAPDEARHWLAHRYAIINVWRSIGPPVTTTPLAFTAANSIDPDDFIASDLVYTDRTGEIYQVAHNADQHWHYFSDMTAEEALLLKVFDSATDGRARWTAHSAFTNPDAATNAQPRRSIELRALVSFAP